ncbi:hypothetical protein [Microvirga solisilvae]|uniref:hypothetical protein n=1 Tax=Microvirga solisilvae TaxID=2919498 RepID=UPI001FAECBF5|nr:hypothetical protein [Microvirga solisilvae]
MATSLLQFRGKGVWLHNAVAEVWLCVLKERLQKHASSGGLTEKLEEEIGEALDHQWIDGILASGIDEHIKCDSQLNEFIQIHNDVVHILKHLGANTRIVSVGPFCAATEYLVREVEMITQLFANSEIVPSS